MNWTAEKPTKIGWYWYHDPDVNMGKPTPAWVFDANRMMWVTLCAVHSKSETRSLSHCHGHWAGPLIPPDLFGERESNP
jgi:hypothetical protein